MKKMIMLGFVCSLTVLFMISSAFAEPYKDKAFPEQQVIQVIKEYCKKWGEKCSYIGKVANKMDAGYTAYFITDRKVDSLKVWQLDSGIWLTNWHVDSPIIIMK